MSIQPPRDALGGELDLVLDLDAVAAAGPARSRGRTPSRLDLDLIVPALNEDARIGRTLEVLGRELARSPFRVRITVVDNGSVDRTVEAVDRACTYGLPVRTISCQTKGKGAAVRAGVRRATAPYVGYVDADQSTPPDAVVTGMAVLLSGWDVVVGSRRAVGGGYVVPQPAVRRVGSRAFNMCATTVVGRMSDTQCGMKLFRTARVRSLFEAVRVGGFAFDVEVLARAKAADLRIMEVPVCWSDSVGSSFRPWRDGVQAFGDLYRLRLALRAAGPGQDARTVPVMRGDGETAEIEIVRRGI